MEFQTTDMSHLQKLQGIMNQKNAEKEIEGFLKQLYLGEGTLKSEILVGKNNASKGTDTSYRPQDKVQLEEEDTKEPTNESVAQKNCRWTSEEKIKFLALLPYYGRSWVGIQREFENRDDTQCRSHGQKYLKAQERLINLIKDSEISNMSPCPETLHLETKRFESNCKNAIAYLQNDETKRQIIWDLYPPYVRPHTKNEQLEFKEKLRQIKVAITFELEHYLRLPKENKQQSTLKRRRVSQ